jgi:hypothetical protein
MALKGQKLSLATRRKVSLNHADVSGRNNPRWNGGRRYNSSGYVLIYSPNHPFKDKLGYVREHRLVMEKKIERYLKKDEIIHHKNEIKDDNRIENLELTNITKHNIHHKLGKKRGYLTSKIIPSLSFIIALREKGYSFRKIEGITGFNHETMARVFRLAFYKPHKEDFI